MGLKEGQSGGAQSNRGARAKGGCLRAVPNKQQTPELRRRLHTQCGAQPARRPRPCPLTLPASPGWGWRAARRRRSPPRAGASSWGCGSSWAAGPPLPCAAPAAPRWIPAKKVDVCVVVVGWKGGVALGVVVVAVVVVVCVCVCVCVCESPPPACAFVCVRACVCVCVGGGGALSRKCEQAGAPKARGRRRSTVGAQRGPAGTGGADAACRRRRAQLGGRAPRTAQPSPPAGCRRPGWPQSRSCSGWRSAWPRCTARPAAPPPAGLQGPARQRAVQRPLAVPGCHRKHEYPGRRELKAPHRGWPFRHERRRASPPALLGLTTALYSWRKVWGSTMVTSPSHCWLNTRSHLEGAQPGSTSISWRHLPGRKAQESRGGAGSCGGGAGEVGEPRQQAASAAGATGGRPGWLLRGVPGVATRFLPSTAVQWPRHHHHHHRPHTHTHTHAAGAGQGAALTGA